MDRQGWQTERLNRRNLEKEGGEARERGRLQGQPVTQHEKKKYIGKR